LRLPNILHVLFLLRLPGMDDNISNLLACVIDARQPIQPIYQERLLESVQTTSLTDSQI